MAAELLRRQAAAAAAAAGGGGGSGGAAAAKSSAPWLAALPAHVDLPWLYWSDAEMAELQDEDTLGEALHLRSVFEAACEVGGRVWQGGRVSVCRSEGGLPASATGLHPLPSHHCNPQLRVLVLTPASALARRSWRAATAGSRWRGRCPWCTAAGEGECSAGCF